MENNYNSFYSNVGWVFHSKSDFLIRFERTCPSITNKPRDKMDKETLDVFMSPEQFKKILETMKGAFDNYEKKTVVIKKPITKKK